MILFLIRGVTEGASSFLVGLTDMASSGLAKTVRAITEMGDKKPAAVAHRIAHEEGLETFWDTLVSSILTKISDVVTPFVPHQIVIIPGKLMGSLIHWLSTTHMNTNTQIQNGNGNKKQDLNLFGKIYEYIVKKPTDYYLRAFGLKENGGSFFRYLLTQLGLIGFSGLLLKKLDKDEELPGVNIDKDEGALKSTLKGIGYTFIEQLTYSVSQVLRYVVDFGNEFGGENWSKSKEKTKEVWAKALAVACNERLFPGHLLGGLGASLSTYFLGKTIPKVTAATFGELPGMALSLLNCHRRRATKYQFEYGTYNENGKAVTLPIAYKKEDGKKIFNYRFNKSPIFNSVLKCSDFVLNFFREGSVKLISTIFKIPIKTLSSAYEISEECLENNRKLVEEKKSKVPTT